MNSPKGIKVKNTDKTAIIIGAGPAGLTAAYCLLKETDIKPIILEESEFIGGISRTAVHNGNRIDIGGHRFFSKSKEVNDIWAELMPIQGAPSIDDKILGIQKPLSESGPDPENEDCVMLVRNRMSRIFFLRKFFDYPISIKARTFKNMGFKRTVKAGCGYIKSSIVKLPEDNLANFYINRFGKPLYEMFFEDYTEKLWGVNPKYLSADWGSQRVKGLSLSKAVLNAITKPFKPKDKVETSLIEQYIYPKKGPGQLWELMAQRVVEMGAELHTKKSVKSFELSEDGHAIRKAITADGSVYEGDVFFSTMPVKDLVCGIQQAPVEVRRVATELPYRDFITVGLLVDKLKLKNNTKIKTLTGDVPDCWIYIQERDVKIGRLQLFNNWSPYMVCDPQKYMWIGLEYFCSEGDEMWSMSDDDFISFAISELEKIDVLNAEDVRDSVRIKVKKAYPAYFGAYYEFDKVREYLDGIENLWCIGRNGQHRYNNMDHSMLTAIEAVNAIKSGSTDKTNVWNVNTEKDYHEENKPAEKKDKKVK